MKLSHIILCFCVFFAAVSSVRSQSDRKCPEPIGTGIVGTANNNPFDALTVDEIEIAVDLLFESSLTSENLLNDGPSLGSECFSYIYLMDPFYPNKTEAVEYLDCVKNCTAPSRYARVTLNRGCEGDVVEYKVGPLDDDGADGTVVQLTDPLPFEVRPRDGIEYRAVIPLIKETLSTLKTLTVESFDGMYYEDDEGNSGGLDYHITAPPGLQSTDRLNRVLTVIDVPGTGRVKDLNPLPLQYRMWSGGSDPDDWYVYDFYYNQQGPFDSAEELLEAYDNGDLDKITLESGIRNLTLEWVRPTIRDGDSIRSLADRAPPQIYQPNGHRFSIDGHVVSWMGWQFHVSSLQQRGPAVRDVRFMGERIAYEISNNDVSLIYSANDPVQGNVLYFDATFGVGETKNMLVGIDCPDTAVYLDDTWYNSGSGANYVERAFCVFEAPTGRVGWRRLDGYQSGLRETELVVRAALPVGNYDYMYDFRFRLQGEIYVVAAASGNIQAYFHTGDLETDPAGTQFGNRVFYHTTGALHDHHFSFKCDLDILGEENWVEKETFLVDTTTNAYQAGPIVSSVPSYEEYAFKRYVKRETVETELDSAIAVDLSEPAVLIISNHDKLNKWGNYRAYELSFDFTTTNDIPTGHPAMPGGSFRKYNGVVSVRKDDEETSTTSFVLNSLADVDYSLDDYIEDDEDIQGVDIVLWVSFGFMHFPRAEDVPIQLTASRGFHLFPYNYFNENPAFDLWQQVRDERGNNVGSGRFLATEPNYNRCRPRKNNPARYADRDGKEPVVGLSDSDSDSD